MTERKKVAFHTLGCKVNSYETDAMRQTLQENGYEIAPFEAGADIYIINTCTVTNIADRKSRQMLHKARKMNPQAIVAAVGCYAQTALEQVQEETGVDIIIGNNRKHEIVQILEAYQGQKKLVAHSDLNVRETPYEKMQISKTAERTRAYIKIQDGCNQFCSYCIIPYARGRVRSRDMDDIIEEAARLAQNHYQEIVLTGIHVSSYGKDLSLEEPLLNLLDRLDKIKGLKRIRLSSLEPMIMTEPFVKRLATLEKLCPHFHLSLQSGCDQTLKRMNRHYTTKDYLQCCDYLRRYFSHPALTTDIIAGFPGETEEEFEETLEFVRKVQFYETHIFKYSKRQGTQAAKMENQIEESCKHRRSAALLELNRINKKKFMEYYIGREVDVLMEESYEYKGVSYQTGYTKEYVKAAARTEDNLLNQHFTGIARNFLNEDALLIKN